MTIKRNLKIPSILALALVGLLVLAGCGGDSDDGSSDEQAVKTAMYEWAAVDTPAAACERMSSGFLFFVVRFPAHRFSGGTQRRAVRRRHR